MEFIKVGVKIMSNVLELFLSEVKAIIKKDLLTKMYGKEYVENIENTYNITDEIFLVLQLYGSDKIVIIPKSYLKFHDFTEPSIN